MFSKNSLNFLLSNGAKVTIVNHRGNTEIYFSQEKKADKPAIAFLQQQIMAQKTNYRSSFSSPSTHSPAQLAGRSLSDVVYGGGLSYSTAAPTPAPKKKATYGFNPYKSISDVAYTY